MDLIFDLEPGREAWTVAGPDPGSAPHVVPNPLRDPGLVALLVGLREAVSAAVPLDHPEAGASIATLEALARRIAETLTPALFSDAARREVVRRIQAADRGRARLVIRVADQGPAADQALALPWELLAPAEGFAVRDGLLDVVREAAVDGAPHLPEPAGALTVAATLAAPDDEPRLGYERESFRLQSALAALGQRVAFSDLGGLADFVEVVKGQKPAAVHFSGHGLPGELVFEDEQGFSRRVPIQDLVRELRRALPGAGAFPRLFFLASCHGATGEAVAGGGLATALGEGPSTAATLHRSGFVQVAGYFGPVGDELCTRAEEVFYRALSRGEETLQAAARARASLREPLAIDGRRVVYPLGWAQLVLYHRGPDRPLALPAEDRGNPAASYRRRVVQLSGLPVLETGFVGRRSLQHEIRRRVERDGVRLIVLQGLGGLGKTALASRLLSHTFAPQAADQLVLRGRGLDGEIDPVAALRAQAENHGRVHGLPQWEERLARLREESPAPAAGFAAVVGEIRKDRPGVVLYLDNAESLQNPAGDWKPAAREWWGEMERLAQGGLVLVSTRYGWPGLPSASWISVDPMSPADVLRMLDAFPAFEALPREARERLVARVDGHPRTLEILDHLVRERLARLGPGFEPADPWTDLIEPVLPGHAEQVRADLLLQELWDRLTAAGREHAVRLGVLRVPAPRSVIDRLGEAAEELVRTGVLTRFREQTVTDDGVEWVDRWGLHGLVRFFVEPKAAPEARQAAHLAAGVAYETWTEERGEDTAGRAEGIQHLHAAGEGDRAWPMLLRHVRELRRQARYGEALGLLESGEAAGLSGERLAEALAFQCQLRRSLGDRSYELDLMLDRALDLKPSDRALCFVISEHGSLLLDRKELDKAEAMIRKLLKLKERIYGPDHPEVAASLHDLAGVMADQERFAESEALLYRSLQIQLSLAGPRYASLLPTLVNLVDLLAVQGRAAEAEPLALRAFEIALETSGTDHPDFAHTLAVIARLQSMLGRDTAPEAARRALAAFEQSLGADHPATESVAPTLRRIIAGEGVLDPLQQAVLQARAAFQRGDVRSAIAAQERAVAAARRGGGDLRAELFRLAGYLGQAELYDEALEPLEEIVGIGERTGHPDLESDRRELETARRFAQIDDVARTVREDAVAALRGKADPDVVAGAMEEMAAGLQALDRSWHALAAYAGAVAAVLRGRPAPEIGWPLDRHLEAVKKAARS
ncbi:MAG: tetratricopeptide repeat protein [Acidobacteriota bacterium]